jgi:hypothetical protein
MIYSTTEYTVRGGAALDEEDRHKDDQEDHDEGEEGNMSKLNSLMRRAG